MKQISTRGKGSPVISVITVVRNAIDSIEETICSVLDQHYQAIEYIVIDGASEDGTIDLIGLYKKRLSYWISEPDEGIYDAMNKGIVAATGDWLIFLNAGDRFFSRDTLLLLSLDLTPDVDIIYGDVEILFEDTRIIKKCGDLNSMWRGMQFCHQSSAVKLERMIATPFNTDNPIAADLEWFISAYDSGHIFFRHSGVIASVTAGGASDINQCRALVFIEKAVRSVRCEWWLPLYFLAARAKVRVKSLIKLVLPKSVLRRIRLLRASLLVAR